MIVKTYEQIYGKQLTIRDLIDGFNENTKTGSVIAFGGNLNIRPPYQREFVYEIDKQKAVIDTVLSGYPLNVMYWAKNGDMFELMDGQQRTMSICKFVEGAFTVEVDFAGKKAVRSYDMLGDKQNEFLDYPLTVYICEGDRDEIKAWFKVINIAGVKLTEQEMRNAIYNSPWVVDAKRYFSRADGEGFLSEGHVSNGHTYGDYVDAVGGNRSEKENSVVRQKLLETVLKWAVDRYGRDTGRKITIDEYMDAHGGDANALELWRYYEDVMEWVRTTFPTYRDLMKKSEWGILYNQYHGAEPDNADEMANALLLSADEISNPKDIYKAVLSGDMKHLNARSFSDADKKWAYEKQKHVCPYCRGEFEYSEMQGDHIRPWSKGGKTERGNLQMLCKECNLKKSNYDVSYRPWDGEEYKSFNIKEWNENE